jgi:hypothetical protein
MVARDGNGRAARPAAGLLINGVSGGDFDNTSSGPQGDLGNDAFNVELTYGVHTFDYTGTAPKANEVCYAVDNHTVSLDSSGGTRGVAGICTETGANSKVEVLIDPALNGALVSQPVSGVLSKSLALTDDLLTESDGSQSFNLGTALPANAVVIGHSVTITEAFTDGSAGVFTLDVGISGALDSIMNGGALGTIATVSGPLGARSSGRYTSAQLLATVLADVNVVTATAGAATVEVFYVTV